MKLLSLLLSTTLLTSTAAVASAAPNATPRKPTIDHRFDVRVERRVHRVRPAPRTWERLSLLRTTGNRAKVEVGRKAGAIDDLRIQVSRGTVHLKKVLVVFADGSRYVAKIDLRLGAGDAQQIRIPGEARRIESVELRYGKTSRAQLTLSAR